MLAVGFEADEGGTDELALIGEAGGEGAFYESAGGWSSVFFVGLMEFFVERFIGGVRYGDWDNDDVADASETGEIDPDAAGLVVEDVDVGYVAMTPIQVRTPTRSWPAATPARKQKPQTSPPASASRSRSSTLISEAWPQIYPVRPPLSSS